MVKSYRYVGPMDIKERARHSLPGTRIESIADLEKWLQVTGQRSGPAGLIAVTFVIDEEGFLRVSDRGSEHVACSGGNPVLSAGELFLRVTADGAEVEEASNQSTGFCPEPASWLAVVRALDRLGIPHPGRFTQEVLFRLCPACGQRNVVKDGWFACGQCGADLPAEWNFDRSE
jgi:hypothetical protein